MVAMITTPRLMHIGGGALAELPGVLRRLELARPLLVTDPFLVKSGHLERATGILDRAGISWSVFSETVADPTTAVVEAGAGRLAEDNYDSLVAIGGGSSIDTAKGMSVLFANGGRMRDYKVPADIPKKGPPIVAIPTTAGTGSEVILFTVITDTETDEKMLIAGLACCPVAAIVDYELTLSMPLRLTADTGLDSLTHAIGAFFHVPHGLSNAMLLPEITAFSVPAALERYADCARAMGVAEEGEGSQRAVARLLDELRRLNEDLKVPSPRAWGIDSRRYDELLPVMASQALASGSPANNPRVPTSDEIIDLYRRVYG